MRIVVKFLATLYDLTGTLSDVVEVPREITLRELIDMLSQKYGKLRSELLDERGELNDMYVVLVNGRPADRLNGLDTRLRDGDEVVFIPPAGGG